MERDGVQAERLDAKTLYKQLSVSSADCVINSLLVRDSIHHTLFPPDEYFFSKEKNFWTLPL